MHSLKGLRVSVGPANPCLAAMRQMRGTPFIVKYSTHLCKSQPTMVFRLGFLLLEKWREGSGGNDWKSWNEDSRIETFLKTSDCPALPVITVSKVHKCSPNPEWWRNWTQVGRLGNQLSSYINLVALNLCFTISPAIPRKVKDTVASFFR